VAAAVQKADQHQAEYRRDDGEDLDDQYRAPRDWEGVSGRPFRRSRAPLPVVGR
jgi:hypothetical protein